MRFLMRGLFGLIFMAMTIAFVGYGIWSVRVAMLAEEGGFGRSQPERSFTVNVAMVEPGTVQPKIVAFGEVRSWRTLEIRATSPGRLVEVSPDFRDGVSVSERQFLAAIDPAAAISRKADAEAALADAGAEQAEAETAILSAEQDLDAAKRRRELYVQALDRLSGLRKAGITSSAAVESAELDVSSADQSLLTKSQALNAANKRVERALLSVTRAQINLEEAERDLKETRIEAAFAGMLADVDATLGHLVSQNEKLGALIDNSALEAVFPVSNAQFARLINSDGTLKQTRVGVDLALGDVTITVPGEVERSAASVGEGQTGRLIYARLDTSQDTVLRDGDFVTVTVAEPPLDNVALLPATAATEDGRVLFVDPESRLEERQLTILRRQGDDLIVAANGVEGRYVVERLPQLGPGVQVRIAEPRGESSKVAAAGGGQRPAGAGPGGSRQEGGGQEDGESIELSQERRATLIDFLKQNRRMPEARKTRMLEILSQPSVPKRLVDQLESRMARPG